MSMRWSYVRRVALALIFLGLVSPVWAINQSLNLELLPTTSTTNRLTVGVSSSGLSDTELTRVTGNALATVGYEIYQGVPLINSIAFTGGQLSLLGASTSNITLSDSNLLSSFNVVGSGLGGELDTTGPASVVSNGIYNTEDHLVIVDMGTLSASGSFLFVPFNYNFNLAQDPLAFTTEGTATIDVSLVSTNGLNRTFEVITSLPVDSTEVIEDTVTITVDVQGTVTARDTFTIAFPLEGDYNGDDVVNIADYTIWRNSLGATGAGLAADGNFDWVVDGADYSLWKDNFGDVVPASLVAVASVPEPSALVLLAAGAVAIAGRMRAHTAL